MLYLPFLKEIVGEVGGKLHTGRSRNDQVAVDMRLWLRQHLSEVSSHVIKLIQVIYHQEEGFFFFFFFLSI